MIKASMEDNKFQIMLADIDTRMGGQSNRYNH